MMPLQFLFFMSMILGVMMTLSATSWLSAWIGLEINAMAFIPILANQKNKINNEAMLKYFLTQTIASAVLLIPIIMPSMNSHLWYPFQTTIMAAALTLKVGAAPMHFWMPQVMEGLSWTTNIILTTIQKIPPMILFLSLKTTMITLFAMLSLTIGALGGFNQTSLRKLMAYSSISHMGGMMLTINMSATILLVYIVVYIILALSMMILFMKTGLESTTQLPMLKPTMFSIVMLNLLSSGGLPPFLGFLPKLLLINALLPFGKMEALILISSAMVTLYFYIRIAYTAFLLSSNIITQTQKLSKSIMILTTTSIWTIPLWLIML